MVKKYARQVRAGVTVEAALICPFLCLVLCGMLQFTLRLYHTVDSYAETLKRQQEQMLPSSDLIRLEAVAEDLF